MRKTVCALVVVTCAWYVVSGLSRTRPGFWLPGWVMCAPSASATIRTEDFGNGHALSAHNPFK